MRGTIRPALAADVPAIARIVHEAYAPYIPRMGQPPGPMLDDYPARVAEHVVWVLETDAKEDGGAIVGIVVLLDAPDHLLLDNVAVAAGRHGQGLGRRLIDFAEAEARRRGRPELRLYTHVTMVENQALYRRLGFVETHRVTEKGFERVYMTKRLG